MDHTDSEILILLQQNARISLSEISGRVNLSVSAVSERLKKLEQSALISRYTAVLNPAAFGKNLSLFVRVQILPTSDLKTLEAFIAKEPDILEFHYLAGRSEAILKVQTADTASLDDILSRLKQQGVGRLSVDLVTSSPKVDVSVRPAT